LTDDRGSHDAIVYAAVNTAIEQEKSVEEFDVQRLMEEGVSSWDALQAESQAGEDHPYTRETITDFGLSLLKQQNSQEAEDILWWAWVGREGEPGEMVADDPGDFMSIFLLGVLYMQHAHYELAEKLLTQALEGCEATCGAEDPLMIDILNTLVQLYESWDMPNEVTKWRSKLRQTEGTVK
jgi:tetratricopeptide (TPR) repeat protein